jgi:site-specific DNA recombinase
MRAGSRSSHSRSRLPIPKENLGGKLFDDKGNLMSPSFSSKNGVRYRFYLSSALLRGRKKAAGSISRIAASEIEGVVLAALEENQKDRKSDNGPDSIAKVESVVIARDRLLIRTAGTDGDDTPQEIRVAWSAKAKNAAIAVERNGVADGAPNEGLIQSIVRAHAWVRLLQEGTYESIEKLADANCLHAKVVRQALRLAYLSPDVTSTILEGRQPTGFSLARVPKLLPLSWTEQQRMLG